VAGSHRGQRSPSSLASCRLESYRRDRMVVLPAFRLNLPWTAFLFFLLARSHPLFCRCCGRPSPNPGRRRSDRNLGTFPLPAERRLQNEPARRTGGGTRTATDGPRTPFSRTDGKPTTTAPVRNRQKRRNPQGTRPSPPPPLPVPLLLWKEALLVNRSLPTD